MTRVAILTASALLLPLLVCSLAFPQSNLVNPPAQRIISLADNKPAWCSKVKCTKTRCVGRARACRDANS